MQKGREQSCESRTNELGTTLRPESECNSHDPVSREGQPSLGARETLIEGGLEDFLEIGGQLRAIRDEELYKDDWGTFEAYCEGRWDWSRANAYQYIWALEVVEGLKETEMYTQVYIPTCKTYAFRLHPLVTGQRIEVAERLFTLREAGERINGALISRIIAEVLTSGQPSDHLETAAEGGATETEATASDEATSTSPEVTTGCYVALHKVEEGVQNVLGNLHKWEDLPQTSHASIVEEAAREGQSRLTRTSIWDDVAGWTWSPILVSPSDVASDFICTGNLSRAVYCPERIGAPSRTRVYARGSAGADPKSSFVLVCPGIDVFDSLIPDDVIESILEEARKTPQWQYLIATANAERAAELSLYRRFPSNCWIGMSIENSEGLDEAEAKLRQVRGASPWLHIEKVTDALAIDSDTPLKWLVLDSSSGKYQKPIPSNSIPNWLLSSGATCRLICRAPISFQSWPVVETSTVHPPTTRIPETKRPIRIPSLPPSMRQSTNNINANRLWHHHQK